MKDTQKRHEETYDEVETSTGPTYPYVESILGSFDPILIYL